MNKLTIGKKTGGDASKQFVADFLISKQYDSPNQTTLKKAEADDEGTFIVEGFASTSDIDTQYSIIKQAALDEGALSLTKYNTLLFNHDMDRPIGKILVAESRPNKLYVKCSVSKAEQDIRTKIQDGTLSKFSIMGEILDHDYEDIEGEQILIIKSMRLFEVSLVSVPANPEAKTLNWYIEKSMNFGKSALSQDTATLEKWGNKKKKKKKTDVAGDSEEAFVGACDTCLGAMETVIANVSGEDKDNGTRYVQWLQAMKESYDTADNNEAESTANETEKQLEGRTVARKNAKDADYVTVLDGEQEQVDEAPVLEKSVADINVAIEGAERVPQAEVAVEQEDAEEVVAPVIEKTVAVKEEVQTAVAPATDDSAIVKSLTAVVGEIKELAKGVVGAVDEANKAAGEAKFLRDEVLKGLEELREVLKGVPVRKSMPVTVTKDAEERLEDGEIEKGRKPKSSIDRTREKVENFDSLNPLDKLRHVLREQVGENE